MDDPDDLRIQEFSEYNPANAAVEARRDIEQGTPRLFYLDVSEFPELLALDNEPGNLPDFARVSIGTGCLDAIHSADDPPGYRAAMENALRYGISYNQALAGHLGLQLKDEPDLLPSDTLDFIGLPADWPGIRLRLDDIHPLFGGRSIWVDGSGTAFVRSVRSDAHGLNEEIYRLDLGRDDIERLLAACLAQDFVSLVSASHVAPPDQARPVITLINGQGQQQSVSNWEPRVPGGDENMDRRFAAVHGELRRLEMVAREGVSPVHTGPYGDPAVWRGLLPE